MSIEIQSLFNLKWKYLIQFWSFIELGIIICSWTFVGIYIWRYKELIRIGQVFKQTNGYVYINLQLSAYINDVLTFVFGFCSFFGIIKFFRLCRFNQRLQLFSQTLQYAGKELRSFSIMFSFLLISFVCLFYLSFHSQLLSCSTLLKTAQTLVEMILSEFNSEELIQAAPFLGPISLTLFTLIVVFICVGIFISIINDSFHLARQTVGDDPEIYSFMLRRFLRWTGSKIFSN